MNEKREGERGEERTNGEGNRWLRKGVEIYIQAFTYNVLTGTITFSRPSCATSRW